MVPSTVGCQNERGEMISRSSWDRGEGWEPHLLQGLLLELILEGFVICFGKKGDFLP